MLAGHEWLRLIEGVSDGPWDSWTELTSSTNGIFVNNSDLPEAADNGILEVFVCRDHEVGEIVAQVMH